MRWYNKFKHYFQIAENVTFERIDVIQPTVEFVSKVAEEAKRKKRQYKSQY